MIPMLWRLAVDPETGRLDYDKIQEIFTEQPKLLLQELVFS
jgi:hypothetical protein